MQPLRFVLALVMLLVPAFAARALEPHDSPMVLVAMPRLHGFYQRTVIFVWPMSSGGHAGFILNRPTKITTAQVEIGAPRPSGRSEPVFLGGPQWLGAVFVITHQLEDPGGLASRIASETFLISDRATLARVIGERSAKARYFTGMVLWRPGELDSELRRGFWSVRAYDASVVFRDSTEGLWEALSEPQRRTL